MKRFQDISMLFLRIAMAATFLSAVASRLNFWRKESSGWKGFLSYTTEVLSFAPASLIPFFAIASTVLETLFSILLIIGFKTRWVALGAAFLTLGFALSMAYSSGIKSPLDYSVFTDAAACFLLATFSYYRWSIDAWHTKRSTPV
jgi:putative oxidoreductase